MEADGKKSWMVGLPVIVRLNDNGTVTFGLCVEETLDAIAENYELPDDYVTAIETAIEHGHTGFTKG